MVTGNEFSDRTDIPGIHDSFQYQKKMLQSDNYEVQFICSEVFSATDEV